MNLKLVFFAMLIVSASMVSARTTAECLRENLNKISDQGKIHAFGIRSDVKIGESLDIKSLWVKASTGELELKLDATANPSREEVDAKIEVADQVVETKDLQTADATEDKRSAWDKLSDVPVMEPLKTPVNDLITGQPTRDTTCAAWIISPHVQFGTAWKFDSQNNRICTQWKEIYRRSECIETDAEGKCTKAKHSLDENASRFECAAKTTESPRNQCVAWKNVDNKSVCDKTETFSGVRVCTDFTNVNNQMVCAKSDVFYPKFRCVDRMFVAGKGVCSKVEAVQPNFFCSEFEVIDNHRYCKTQSVYYDCAGAPATHTCTHALKVAEDNCELHCLKYEVSSDCYVELLEFGNEFFVDTIETKEIYTIDRQVVVIPRPLNLLNEKRSIQVTDVYIPVSNIKSQGETMIYPGQIKEFAGMFGAITVDKVESLTTLPNSQTSTSTHTDIHHYDAHHDVTKHDTSKHDDTKHVDVRHPVDHHIDTHHDNGKHIDSHHNTDSHPAVVCVHPDREEVLRIIRYKDLIYKIESDVVNTMKTITKDQTDFNNKCDADVTKALRAKIISEFRDVIYREYKMIRMARVVLRDAIFQATNCPTDRCVAAFKALIADVTSHVRMYLKSLHKSVIIVDHMRRMVIKPCCCSSHWEILHTIKKYSSVVHGCGKCQKTLIKKIRTEVKTVIAQALAKFHPAAAPVAPKKITPPPKFSGEPSLTITRVLRGKEAILAYLAHHHKYFLSLLKKGDKPVYKDRFLSWRESYNHNKKLADLYAPAAAQCKTLAPTATVTVGTASIDCETVTRRLNRFQRRMARYARRLKRAGVPLVPHTVVPKHKVVALPKKIDIKAELARERALRLAARRARIAARKARREQRRKARALARKQRRAARIVARKHRREQRKKIRAARIAARKAFEAKLLGRKLVSNTRYGRMLNTQAENDAKLVDSIRANLSTFRADDKAILSQCFN